MGRSQSRCGATPVDRGLHDRAGADRIIRYQVGPCGIARHRVGRRLRGRRITGHGFSRHRFVGRRQIGTAGIRDRRTGIGHGVHPFRNRLRNNQRSQRKGSRECGELPRNAATREAIRSWKPDSWLCQNTVGSSHAHRTARQDPHRRFRPRHSRALGAPLRGHRRTPAQGRANGRLARRQRRRLSRSAFPITGQPWAANFTPVRTAIAGSCSAIGPTVAASSATRPTRPRAAASPTSRWRPFSPPTVAVRSIGQSGR